MCRSVHCDQTAHILSEEMATEQRDTLVLLKRKIRTNQQSIRRLSAVEHIPPSVKIMVAILVLMTEPWDMIKAIVKCTSGFWRNMRIASAWTIEKIQEVAKDGVKLKPSLLDGQLNNEDVEVFRARRWVAEFKLCLWLLHHNLKGITVPAELVVEEYKRMWGMGPHGARLTQHLWQLLNKPRQKKWCRAFRDKWPINIGCLPRRACLQPSEIEEKVRGQHMQQATHSWNTCCTFVQRN